MTLLSRTVRGKNQPPSNSKPHGALSLSQVAAAVETPAFVLDERIIRGHLETAAHLRARCGCKVLYALKPLACPFVLELMNPWLDGFAASSLFEARLVRSVAGEAGRVHITTPGLREAEMPELDTLCDFVAFNSLQQMRRLAPGLGSVVKCGLRVNPGLSLVADERYNPCRPHSKLGVPIDALRQELRRRPELGATIGGLHFHSNCDASSFDPLLGTVRHLADRLRDWLPQMRLINLGGGYLLDPSTRTEPLLEAIEILRSRSGSALEVFIEPGAGFVREAGYLVAEVIDLFRSGGRSIAVLDTTVNHAPEIFEYQFEPDVAGHDDDGEYEYLLAGSTCLAGDVMGEYAFTAPLRIGSRVVLTNLGAYALVKAHMFNGVNLPTIYSVTTEGRLVERRRFTYHDFVSRTGAKSDAVV
jgi:carboxynorspermidine decarboxylase